jgi:tetratricopeptide (TPR) repeat protein
MNCFPDQPKVFLPCHRSLLPTFVLLISFVGKLFGQGGATEAFQTPAVRAHFEAAQEAQKHSDFATAEREYQAVLAAAPQFAEVHMNLGLVHQLENRIPEAMADFRRALAIKPALAGYPLLEGGCAPRAGASRYLVVAGNRSGNVGRE